MARHELEVAKFYFARKAYVAAANRAAYVVEHIEGTPEVGKALEIMVRSYRALGAEQKAAETYKILKINFPKRAVKFSVPFSRG